MALKAVIFDVDGTLAETERDGHRRAFNDAFNELGLDWYWDENLYGDLLAVGGGRERLEAYVKFYLPKPPRNRRNLIDQLHKVKARFYCERVAAGQVPLRPGIARLLDDELHAAGLRVAVATNSSSISLDALVQRYFGCPAQALFDVVITGDNLARKKPAPDAYRQALDGLGLGADECVAVEDSCVGLQAAAALAVPTLITVSEYTREEDFTGAARVLSDLGEPDRACSSLQGAAPPAGHVDIAYLQSLLP